MFDIILTLLFLLQHIIWDQVEQVSIQSLFFLN
jgi:hypothetical protein